MISDAKKAQAEAAGLELSKRFSKEIEASGLSGAAQAALGMAEFRCGLVVLGLLALPGEEAECAARILAGHITRLVAAAFPRSEAQS